MSRLALFSLLLALSPTLFAAQPNVVSSCLKKNHTGGA